MNKDSQSKKQIPGQARPTPSPHAADQIGIYRGFDSARGGDLFHVALLRNGKTYQKDFFFKRCGGEQLAMRLAQAWRDMVIARHPPMSMSEFCSIVRSNNTSGVPGVYRTMKSHRAKIGRVSKVYWHARVPLAGGKHRIVNFSVSRLGEEEARMRAMASRVQSLQELESIVFRASRQPQPVSTESDILMLEAKLRAPMERRMRQEAKREAKRQRDDNLLAARLAQSATLEREALETATNLTGEPYIGRHETTSGTGQYWRVSIIRQGTRYRKTFSDSVHGSTHKALLAAKGWRDQLFSTLPVDSKATVVSRVKATNTSGVAGVTRASAERKGQVFQYWVAASPKVKGRQHRSKRFSIDKYGNEVAFQLATCAREAFVDELRNVVNLHHRAARQMQRTLHGQE